MVPYSQPPGTPDSTPPSAAVEEIIPALRAGSRGCCTRYPVVVLVTGSRSSRPLAAEQAFRRLSEQMRDRILRIAVGMADYDPAGTDAFASVGKVAALDEFGDIIGEPVERKLVFPVPEPGLLDKELQAACKAVAAAQIIDDDLPVFDDDFPGPEVILTPLNRRYH